jgi:hypothetical protein
MNKEFELVHGLLNEKAKALRYLLHITHNSSLAPLFLEKTKN